jgi:hypothetical protein
VLAGPFTGEVGFELLYWIPMLRWAVREFPELRGRLIAVSRGGVQDWLKGLDAQYFDVLDLFSPEDFAAHRAIADKQRRVQEFESRAVAAVEERLALPEISVLHPQVLYYAYFRFLKVNELAYSKALVQGADHAEGLASIYQPIQAPDLGRMLDFLPDDYVAVRFYSSASFPITDESRRFASAVIEALSRTTNVVVLGHPFQLDDHGDVSEPPAGVFTIDHLTTPANNLAIQTAAVGRSKAFVGTYGGFAYLAPFLGVPSLGFSFDRSRTLDRHNVLAQRLFEGPAWGRFVALRGDDLPLIEMVTREIQFDGVASTRE